MLEDLITPTAAANLLGLNVATIYRWIKDARLPAFNLGWKMRVSRTDVEGLVQRRVTRQAPPQVATAQSRTARERHAVEVLRKNGFKNY